MRKILIGFLLFMACSDKYMYETKYIIYYPNENDTIIKINKKGFYFGSDRGSNFIKEGSITGNTIYKNTAPYKVLYYKKFEK